MAEGIDLLDNTEEQANNREEDDQAFWSSDMGGALWSNPEQEDPSGSEDGGIL